MTTDIQRWQRIRALVESAMELTGRERARLLDVECRGDASLRSEVEELLEHDSPAEDLATPTPDRWIRALAGELDFASVCASDETGRRIGVYRLVREIGSGGMGKVYLAERNDSQYEKRVAVKLVKRGMDTDDILRRFKIERQILAQLEHPNIARLLDGGATDDGLPYVVLEYVDGIPIDRWCDQRRSTVPERIELFLAVCSAVQYAHQGLVVHRDIKPSNILVTPQGVPKLLDFGIAKLLGSTEADLTLLHTSTNERRLTPAYASPEQLRGDPITTASDVFSLGVVLYELLSGVKPFEVQDRSAESAAFHRPDKPSTVVATSQQRSGIGAARSLDVSSLRRLLSGDLDTIVLKALHADPARRYLSAEQLAADLRRHLDGLPVQARPDSFGYRTSKFAKRNRLLVGAVGTILVALAVGFTTSTVLYFKAVDAQAALKEKSELAEDRLRDAELARAAEKVQRELAEQRFADVRKLATTFIFDVHSAIEPLQGSLAARQLIVKTATQYLEHLASEKRDDADLQLELAHAWLRIGAIQSSYGMASLGQTSAALKSIQRATAILQDLVRDEPRNTDRSLLLIDSHIRMAEVLIALHRLPEARGACEQTLTHVERLAVEHPDSRPFELRLLSAHNRLGDVQSKMGEYDDSLEHYRAAAAISEKLAGDWIGDDFMQGTLGASLQQLGRILEKGQHFEEALKMQRRALEVFERLVVRDPTRAGWRREIGVCRSLMARAWGDQGCNADAGAESRRSLEIMLSLSHDDGMNAAGLSDSASALIQFASNQLAAGESQEAVRYCRAALGYFGDLVQRDPDDLDVRHNLATARGYLASALIESGSHADGLRVYQEACDEFEALAAAEPSDTSVQIDLHYCYAKMGKGYARVAEANASNPAQHIRNLCSARIALGRGLEGLRRLRSDGSTTEVSDLRIDAFEEDLRRCEENLARLDADAQDGRPELEKRDQR